MDERALPQDVQGLITRLASSPTLLVGCDFDGTLAPIVADPQAARGLPEALRSLEVLAGMSGVDVVVVSGRSLTDLRRLCAVGEGVQFVGGHGAEFESGHLPPLEISRDQVARLGRIRADVAVLTRGVPGIFVEEKPTSVAVHVRNVDRDRAARVTQGMLEGPAARDGVTVLRGKGVIELSVVTASKGTAIAALQRATEAAVTLFIGDDVTDEQAFAALGPTDAGIKVGPGDSLAGYRVEDEPRDVARVLADLIIAREASAQA